MMHYWDWNGGWQMPFFGIGPLVLILLLAGLAYLLLRSSRAGASGGAETPRQIVERRYASGEITKEQLDEMRRNLA